jgi:hypothetical protein
MDDEDKIAFVFVELSRFSYPEPAVINNFHANKGASEGDEQLLTPLQVRHGFSKRQMRKTAFVFVELSLFSFTGPAVINNFYAETGT